LVSRVQGPGYYSTIWDGADDRGRQVSSGVYFVSFRTDDYRDIKKTILLK